MNILPHLQELDDLVIEHTKPPLTAMLRNKLAFCIEQAAAHFDAVERQSQTLNTQMETIARLMMEKAVVEKQRDAMQAEKRRSSEASAGLAVFQHEPPSLA